MYCHIIIAPYFTKLDTRPSENKHAFLFELSVTKKKDRKKEIFLLIKKSAINPVFRQNFPAKSLPKLNHTSLRIAHLKVRRPSLLHLYILHRQTLDSYHFSLFFWINIQDSSCLRRLSMPALMLGVARSVHSKKRRNEVIWGLSAAHNSISLVSLSQGNMYCIGISQFKAQQFEVCFYQAANF